MKDFNEWNETIMSYQEFRDELVYLASLLPSKTYYRFWVILLTVVFSPTIGWLAPHLADWAKYFRGDYDVTSGQDKYGEYVEIKIFTQLTGDDWNELVRAAKNKTRELEPKTTRKKGADDLRMLAILANLARDSERQFSYGQLATKLSDMGYTDKTPVIGVVEKGGMAKAVVAHGGVNATVALPFLRATIKQGSTIHTDESRIYSRVKRDFTHEFVNHAKDEYVCAGITTNSIEGFWSQMKNSIRGTHHAVSPKYLQTYVNQFVFLYNHQAVAVGPVLLERALKRVG